MNQLNKIDHGYLEIGSCRQMHHFYKRKMLVISVCGFIRRLKDAMIVDCVYLIATTMYVIVYNPCCIIIVSVCNNTSFCATLKYLQQVWSKLLAVFSFWMHCFLLLCSSALEVSIGLSSSIQVIPSNYCWSHCPFTIRNFYAY